MVAGQDVEQREDGTFASRKVAKDRTISTVDTEARHGHKSHDRHFDGFKAHVLLDPDSGLIDEVAATAGNVADRDALDELLSPVAAIPEKPAVFGDSAYADGQTLEGLEGQGFEVMAKVPQPLGSRKAVRRPPPGSAARRRRRRGQPGSPGSRPGHEMPPRRAHRLGRGRRACRPRRRRRARRDGREARHREGRAQEKAAPPGDAESERPV